MKAKELREKLNNKYHEKPKKFNKNYKGNKNDELYIIGITGSRGKSSIAYMLNEYLKNKNYKTVLYSSIKVDSEMSYIMQNEAKEVPLKNEEELLNAIAEALDYEADYLILEINESTLSKNIIDELTFDMRIMTNIIPKQNDVIYENYVDLKKSFFRKAEKKEHLIIGLVDPETIDLYNELKGYNFTTYTTNYFIDRYNLKKNKIDFYLDANDEVFESINGLCFDIFSKKDKTKIQTNLIFSYNAINILSLYTIIKTLDVYDKQLFNNLIKELIIPGRENLLKANNRYIMISTNLVPHLEHLKTFKTRGEINNIILVTGAAGAGYKDWHKEIPLDLYMQDKIKAMEFAYRYISQNVDKLYITLSDNGTIDEDEWLNYQESLVTNNILVQKIKSRKEAIETAIKNSNEKDVIFISGRGNRRIMCDGEKHISIFNDIEETIKIIEKGEK